MVMLYHKTGWASVRERRKFLCVQSLHDYRSGAKSAKCARPRLLETTCIYLNEGDCGKSKPVMPANFSRLKRLCKAYLGCTLFVTFAGLHAAAADRQEKS